jgi:hypothetical protein
MGPIWLQHTLVVALAATCAIVMLVRRLRALGGSGPLCDGCAGGSKCGGEPTRASDAPIPVSALLRRRAH